jgi:phospholipid transport system substrate-binding protein
VKLFANLLEQTYIARIDEYGGERITYVGEQIDGDRATVQARIMPKKGGEVSVESRLLRKEDRWLIYDVLIEGISLIGNYRSQFDRILRTASYEDLVKRLKARSELLNEKDANPPRARTPAER